MTRTDVMASSRPRTAGAAPIRRGPSAGLRGLLTLVALLLALALVPGAAVAAEPTSGYTTTTTTPAATTPTTPAKGTLPSKEAEKPASEPAPAKTAAPQSSTLPFTGFDLRWDVGFGLLLMVAGLSIVAVQRRQRRDGGR